MTEEEISDIATRVASRIADEMSYPRWLKLSKAARYVSVNTKRIVSLAEAGEIVGFRDPGGARGDWIFDRQSLDNYRLSQLLEIEGKI